MKELFKKLDKDPETNISQSKWKEYLTPILNMDRKPATFIVNKQNQPSRIRSDAA